jgi:hypothetical protein
MYVSLAVYYTAARLAEAAGAIASIMLQYFKAECNDHDIAGTSDR